MYHIPHFKAKDQHEVIQFMQAHPFVTICGVDEAGFPVATQIPILLDIENDKIVIYGHIMRNQAHTNAFEINKKVLVLFSGPSTFISANWYTDKAQASTWNYQSVQAKGEIVLKNKDHLYRLLERLTLHFEKDVNAPTQVKNLSPEYMEQNMKAIVSFEIVIDDLQHVFKLSQNRDEATKQNIQSELNKGNAACQHIAAAMKK